MSEHAIAQPQKIASPANTSGHAGLLQRKCACGGSAGLTGRCADCDEKRLTLRRRVANQPEPATVPPLVEEVLRSAGQPLDEHTRNFMESHFGHDFSRVRVHTDARAAMSARAVNASAYTVGQQMVFDAGQYQPATQAGRSLLAHELAHVVQQGDGNRFQGKLEIGSPHSADEREADEAAAAIESPAAFESKAAAPPLLPGKHDGSPSILRRKTGDAGSWFRGLFSSLLFGTFSFPESWLQDYLKKLDETGDIEGDPDSDDKAREITNDWKKGGSKFVLTAQRKALLIHEMLDGPTLWGDEEAILELLERSYNFELSYIFGPGGITAQRLGEDIPDEPGDRLRQFYVDRFEGGRAALLENKVKPVGAPIKLGVELPPVGARISENIKFDKGSTGWDVPCVLGLLCTQDSAVVRQLPSLNVKTMERIEVTQWTFDGSSWKSEVLYPSGVNKPDLKLVGLVRNASCNAAARTMFHEVHHQNQPASIRKTHFTMEVDAYKETEAWAITRGFPEELTSIDSISLRQTDQQGVETPSIKGIEKKVTKLYGGPTADSEGEIVGHAPNIRKVKVPGKDKPDEQKAEAGDTYLEEPPNLVKPEVLNPKDWVCPGQKPEPKK